MDFSLDGVKINTQTSLCSSLNRSFTPHCWRNLSVRVGVNQPMEEKTFFFPGIFLSGEAKWTHSHVSSRGISIKMSQLHIINPRWVRGKQMSTEPEQRVKDLIMYSHSALSQCSHAGIFIADPLRWLPRGPVAVLLTQSWISYWSAAGFDVKIQTCEEEIREGGGAIVDPCLGKALLHNGYSVSTCASER